VHKTLHLLPQHGALRAAMYSHKAVINEQIDNNGCINLEIKLQEMDFSRILKAAGLKSEDLVAL
jgi:GTP-binding protein HflX